MTVQRSGTAILGALLAVGSMLAGGPSVLAQPNLSIFAFHVPAQAPLGEAFPITVVVENVGNTPSNPTQIGIFLDGSPDPLTGFQLEGLSNGSRVGKTTMLTLASPITTGAHQLVAKVDPTPAGESFLTAQDNQAPRPIELLPPPNSGGTVDLVAIAFTAPDSAAIGESFSVTATIENTGTARSAPTKVKILLRREDPFFETLLEEAPFDPLDAGQERQIAIVATLGANVTTGSYVLGCLVDAQPANEPAATAGDNRAVKAGPFEVTPGTPPAAPDLAILDFQAPLQAPLGEAVPITLVVKNKGSANAPATSLFIFLDDSQLPLKVLQLEELAPGAEVLKPSQLLFSSPVTAGPHRLTAKIDPDAIGEPLSTAADNQFPRDIEIASPDAVDLAAMDLACPAAAAIGEAFPVTATVKNEGTLPSKATMVKVFLKRQDPPFETLLGEAPLEPLNGGAERLVPMQAKVQSHVTTGNYVVGFLVDAQPAGEPAGTAGNNTFVRQGFFEVKPGTLPPPDGPNLVMESVEAQFAATVPGNIAVGATFRNAGNQPAGTFVVKFLLSTDNVFNPPGSAGGGDIPFGDNFPVSGLASDETKSLTATVGLPQSLTPSSYVIFAVADATRAITETNEFDNHKGANHPTDIQVLEIGKPDLVVEMVTFSSTITPTAGAEVTVGGKIRNGGATEARGFGVQFFLSPDQLFDMPSGPNPGDRQLMMKPLPQGPLASGASTSLSTKVTLPAELPAGDYFVFLVADVTDAVTETNESNNTGFTPEPFHVQGPVGGNLPDLVARALTAPATAAAGELIALRVEVHNLGTADAAGFGASFALSTDDKFDPPNASASSDVFLTEMRRSPLPAGQIDTITTSPRIPATLREGPYFTLMAADRFNQVAELDEENNGISTLGATQISAASAAELPDLVVDDVTPGAAAPVGGVLTIAAAFHNQGAVASPDWGVRFFLSPDSVFTAPAGGTGDIPLGELIIRPKLQPLGGSDQFSSAVLVPQNVAPGEYFVAAVANPEKLFHEAKFDNNILVSTLRTQVQATSSTSGPDLVAMAVSGSGVTTAGSRITLVGAIQNEGTTGTGPFGAQLLLQSAVTPTAMFVLGEEFFSGLASGEPLTFTTERIVPTFFAPGSYFVRLHVDLPSNRVAESNETNNKIASVSSVEITPPPTSGTGDKPDLVVTAVGGGSNAAPNGPYSFLATVHNRGKAPAGKFRVAFGFSRNQSAPAGGLRPWGRLLADHVVSGLPAGQSVEVSRTVTLPENLETGTFYPAAGADDPIEADPTLAVAELDEQNNYRVSVAPVFVRTGEDLALPDLKAEEVAFVVKPNAAGLMLDLKGAIRNVGTTPSSGFEVAFLLEAGPTATAAPPPRELAKLYAVGLSTFETFDATATVQLPPDVPAGFYFIRLEADPGRLVREGNDFNNSIRSLASFTVGPPPAADRPNLTFTAVGGPPVALLGQKILVSADLTNTGPISATHFAVAFNLASPADTTGELRPFFLGEVPVRGLGSHAGTNVTTELFVPGFMAPGKYKVLAFADPQKVVEESNEEDNHGLAAEPTDVSGTANLNLPDLVSLDVTSTTTAQAGQFLDVNGVVANRENTGFAFGFTVGFGLTVSDAPLETQEPGRGLFVLGSIFVGEGMEPGTQRPVGGRFAVPLAIPPGQYFLVMLADESEKLPELDENNNGRFGRQRVSVAGSEGGQFYDLVAHEIRGPVNALAFGDAFDATASFFATGLTTSLDVPLAFQFFTSSGDVQALTTRVRVEPAGKETFVSKTVKLRMPPLPPAPIGFPKAALSFVIDPNFALQEPHHNNRPPAAWPLVLSEEVSGELPNLEAVSVLDPPAEGKPGSLLALEGTVRNTSTVEVFKPFALEFALEAPPQGGLPGGVFHLGRIGVERLAGNETITRTFSAPLPPLRAGEYRVQMRVDPENFVAETLERDNQVLSASVMKVQDLQTGVTDLEALGVTRPTSAELGASLSLSGKVANRGENPAPAFGVSFVLSPELPIGLGNFPIGTVFVPGLAAGQEFEVPGLFPLPPFFKPGSYYVGMVVDSANLVAETDERNNVTVSSGQMAVTAPAEGGRLVDLAAASVAAKPASTRETVLPGEAIQISGQVQNLTTQAVPVPFDVAFFATKEQILTGDDPSSSIVGEHFPIGRLAVPGIGAEEVREVQTETHVPPFVRPGPYFVAMVVDPDGRLPELPLTRENNKVLSANPIRVTTPEFLKDVPDLVATSVIGAEQTTAGHDLSIKWGLRGDNIRRPFPFHVVFMVRPETTVPFQEGQTVVVEEDGELRRFLPIGRVEVPGLVSQDTSSYSTSYSDTTALRIPAELPKGQYVLAMAIDPENRVPELDRQNNFLESFRAIEVIEGTPLPVIDNADSIAEVQFNPEGTGRDDLLLNVPPKLAGLQKKTPAGDIDVFTFPTEPGKIYEVSVFLEGLLECVLEIRDSSGTVKRDFSQGVGSRVVFEAVADRYYAVVSAPEAYQTGTYRIGARGLEALQKTPDIVPGHISVKPELPTSSTKLTAFFSVGNGGDTTASKFRWELRLVDHVEQTGLLFRPDDRGTVVGSGEVLDLPPATGRPMDPVEFGPLPEGRYDLQLIVDAANDITETEEGNNSRFVPFAVGRTGDGRFARADLVPALVQVDPFRATTSDLLQVKAAVANRGGSPVATFAVSIYLDRTSATEGTLLKTVTVEHMAPDSVIPLEPETFGPLPEGQHNLVAIVDSGEAIGEAVETNNVRVQEFFVAGAESAGYDLTVEHVGIVPGDPQEGQPADIGVLIANRGLSNSPASELLVLVDPDTSAGGFAQTTPTTQFPLQEIGSREVKKVGPLPLPPFSQVGRHRIVVWVKSSDDDEANKANNQLSIEVSVGEKREGTAQFVVDGLVLDSSGNPVGPGYEVRAINKARRAVSSPSMTPSSASNEGSYSTTFGGPGANRFVVVEGDTIVFEVISEKGERLQISDPASRVVTEGEVKAGAITQDLLTAPPPRDEVTVEILKPVENARFFPDDKIEFRGQGTDEEGNPIAGRRLVWLLGNPPRTVGVGENFVLPAQRLKLGRNELALKAIGRGKSNIARRIIHLDDAVADTDRLAIFGHVRSAPQGTIPSEPLKLTLENLDRKAVKATVEVDRATGRYSVEFTGTETAVAGPGERFKATLTGENGVVVPIAPPVFSIGRRAVAAGEHERNFRAHFEPPVTVDLYPGVNLLSVPLRPVTDGVTYTAASLAQDAGLDWVVRTETGEDGQPRFRVYLPDPRLDLPAFELTGNEGYICSVGEPNPISYTHRGVQWEEEQVDREVGRGVNSIGYPRDVPEGHNAGDLAAQLGASFVVRTERDPQTGRAAFRPFVPGGTESFDIRRGMGYLLGSPQEAPLTLENRE